jgi:hypothetical protein
MKIRKNVTVFLNGCLQTADLDENGKIVKGGGRVVAPVPEEKKEPTKLELMGMLKGHQVQRNPLRCGLEGIA